MTIPARLAAAMAMALALSAACTVPPVPSQPTHTAQLEVRGTTLMMVGGRGALSAWEFDGDRYREVQARWTADGDAISMNSSGSFTARRLGAATVRAQYGDLVGTATVHVVPSVAGTWRGSITVLDCWQTVATTPDPCANRRGLVAPFTVVVSQTDAAELGNLTGTLQAFTPAATGNFVGLLDSGGVFFIQGHVERAQDRLATAISFRWMLEEQQLNPLKVDDRIEDQLDVQLGIRAGSESVAFSEIWRMSPLTR
jgi:hypothetical protein